MVTPSMPSSPALRKVSTGKCCASSHSFRCGLISLAANSRTMVLIWFCSSVRRKSIDDSSKCIRIGLGSGEETARPPRQARRGILSTNDLVPRRRTTQPCNQTCYIFAPSNPSSGDPLMLKRLLPAAAAFLFLALPGHAADSRQWQGDYDLLHKGRYSTDPIPGTNPTTNTP